jgi:hypothetical protein
MTRNGARALKRRLRGMIRARPGIVPTIVQCDGASALRRGRRWLCGRMGRTAAAGYWPQTLELLNVQVRATCVSCSKPLAQRMQIERTLARTEHGRHQRTFLMPFSETVHPYRCCSMRCSGIMPRVLSTARSSAQEESQLQIQQHQQSEKIK